MAAYFYGLPLHVTSDSTSLSYLFRCYLILTLLSVCLCVNHDSTNYNCCI